MIQIRYLYILTFENKVLGFLVAILYCFNPKRKRRQYLTFAGRNQGNVKDQGGISPFLKKN